MLWLFRGDQETAKYLHYQLQNHRLRQPTTGRGRPGAEWFSLSAVRAAFRYYGVDPDTLVESGGKLVLAGELPEGLLPPPGWRSDAGRARKRRSPAKKAQRRPGATLMVGDEVGWLTVSEVQEGGYKVLCRCGFETSKSFRAIRRDRSCASCKEAERAERFGGLLKSAAPVAP